MLDFEDCIANDSRLQADGGRVVGGLIQENTKVFVESRDHKSPQRPASTPTVPPFVIIEAMIEPYFENINPHFPIWSKEGFRKIMHSRRHSASPEFDWASIVCCNNLILINLTADSVHSFQRKLNQSGTIANSHCVDYDLIAGFLTNAKRAIDNIGLLVVDLRLINLQALLSLVCPPSPVP